MRILTTLFAATAIAMVSAATLAKPTTQQSAPTTTSSPFGHTGQPHQSCEDIGNHPRPRNHLGEERGNHPGRAGSSDNTGSAFSENGRSGTVYAGEQPGINDK